MIKQKKTKKKNVNVNQTVVVNIQKGKRNPRAKAQPQVMNAPQIIPPQVGSAYHQAVYGARAPAIPSMGNIAGYYGGMMSPFNAPLHVASEVQQAQLRQANELAGQNVQRPLERVPVRSVERIPESVRIPEPERMPQQARRPSLVSSEARAPSGLRPISRLVGELEAQLRPSLVSSEARVPSGLRPIGIPEQAPLQVVEEKRKPIRVSFYPGSYEELQPVEQPPPVKPKPIRMSFYPGSYDELPFASSVSGVSDSQPVMSMPISFSKPSAPLSMEAPEPVASSSSMEEKYMEAPEQVASSSSESAPRRKPKLAPAKPERGDDQPNYADVVDWVDRQTVKQGNSPIGLTKDAFIEQLSQRIGRTFTVGNLKNKSFDEIKRIAKKFINTVIQAGR